MKVLRVKRLVLCEVHTNQGKTGATGLGLESVSSGDFSFEQLVPFYFASCCCDKHQGIKQLGEGRVYLADTSGSQPISKGSRRSQAGTKADISGTVCWLDLQPAPR